MSDTKIVVFRALKEAYPHGRTRRQLIWDVYKILVPNTVDLNNNKHDRKIRLTIAALQDDLIPIVSSSSKAGYRLDLNPATVEKMSNEFKRRRDQYDHKIERANRMTIRLRYARESAIQEPVITRVHQMELGETA